MFDIALLLPLIPALPLAAAIIIGAFGPWLLRNRSHLPAVAAIGLSCVLSLLLLWRVHRETTANAGQRLAAAPQAQGQSAGNHIEHAGRDKLAGSSQSAATAAVGFERVVCLWTWAVVDQAGVASASLPADDVPPDDPGPVATASAADSATARPAFSIQVALRADPLTAVMLATVTLVSLVVAVYSIGYMHGDPGYWRFFAYISLFVFSMTMLVSASNFILLYVFWEAVGLCSYLLIGFWYQKPEAAAAGKKAFIVNRVGDFGFALGVFLLWTTYGTLDFHDGAVPGILGQARLSGAVPFVGGATATAICLLLMLGACGKSAQFPLHVWLPDAMEGPTPVSALIHAATMVTAGVYMVARCTPLYLASAEAPQVVAVIGGATALMAALIAITQTDLKRILAYSTISQLGYMFLALGAGTLVGVTAGMFHLFTHAFFKALLFLGAGSVMHAMGGVIDIRRFSGLRHVMPITHWTFLIGCLGLAGVFPLAGFWSKDPILAALHERAATASAGSLYYGLFLAGLLGAALTAFYTFRAFFATFYGPLRTPPEAGHHAHESPPSMTGPLLVLAVATAVVGAAFGPTHLFDRFLVATPSLAYANRLAEQAAVAAEGHAAPAKLAAPAAHAPQGAAEGHAAPSAHGAHTVIALLSQAVVMAGIALAALVYLGRVIEAEKLAALLDRAKLYTLSYRKMFWDEIYQALIVWPAWIAAQLCAAFDRLVIDGLVDLCGLLPKLLGSALRPLQNGLVQYYALAMVIGLLLLLGALLW